MNNINIKIKKLSEKCIIPNYQSEKASGFDIHACIEKEIIISKLERKLISCGFAISIPDNYEAQIRPRSGLAIKYGITILNSPGTIDCDYRGEIKVILVNLGNDNFYINNGDRIAQMVIMPICRAKLTKSDILDDTTRSNRGFGSTGI